MTKIIHKDWKYYTSVETLQEINSADIITALEYMNAGASPKPTSLELKSENEWRPTHPGIIINPEKWGYNEDWRLDPQACEYEGNWYYNFPAAQLIKWVPTKKQWEEICEPYWDDWEKLSKELWLTMAGYRGRSTGLFNSQGTNGYYWSSSPSTTNGFYLYFNSANVRPTNNNLRAYGFALRCIKD